MQVEVCDFKVVVTTEQGTYLRFCRVIAGCPDVYIVGDLNRFVSEEKPCEILACKRRGLHAMVEAIKKIVMARYPNIVTLAILLDRSDVVSEVFQLLIYHTASEYTEFPELGGSSWLWELTPKGLALLGEHLINKSDYLDAELLLKVNDSEVRQAAEDAVDAMDAECATQPECHPF